MLGRYLGVSRPAVHHLLLRNEPYMNADVESDPRTRGTDLSPYRRAQIRASICVPLHKQGQLAAVIAIHQASPRRWTADEVDLVRTVGDRCWESLERIRALVRDPGSHHRATEPVDGAEAFRKWKSGRYSLVLTDCNMPEMSGYDLARAIRQAEDAGKHERCPILACTAAAMSDEVLHCIEAGMDAYLVKPMDLNTLMKELTRWLPGGAGGDGVAIGQWSSAWQVREPEALQYAGRVRPHPGRPGWAAKPQGTSCCRVVSLDVV